MPDTVNPDTSNTDNPVTHTKCNNSSVGAGYNDFVELPDVLFETDPTKLSPRIAARIYMDLGFSLLPLLPGEKRCIKEGWNSDSFKLEGGKDHWEYYSSDGIGVHLARSGLVTVDIDFKEGFIKCMDAVKSELMKKSGVEHPFWEEPTALIISGVAHKGKIVFRVPEEDMEFTHRSITWKNDGCIFELRCMNGQDVLPPSIHPKTQRRYRWEGLHRIAPMPEDLIYLWEHWDDFAEKMIAQDPEYEPPKPVRKTAKKFLTEFNDKYSAIEIAEMWSNLGSLEADLEAYGYKHTHGNRYVYCHSSTGSAGVTVKYGNPDVFFTSHGSDPFPKMVGSKHIPYNRFGLMLYFNYNGCWADALKQAKADLVRAGVEL